MQFLQINIHLRWWTAIIYFLIVLAKVFYILSKKYQMFFELFKNIPVY